MNVKDIFKTNLEPVNEGDISIWNEFLNNLNEDVLWLPNARKKFKYMRGYIYEERLQENFPSVFLYTDHYPNRLLFDLLQQGEHVFEDIQIKVNNVIDLKANWNYQPDYNYLSGSDKRILACYRGKCS